MAKKMDEILSIANETGIHTVTMPDFNENRDFYHSIGRLLEQKNYGKWLGGDIFMVFSDGITFIRSNSFLKLMEEYQAETDRKRANEDAQARLTAFQIEAAKREHKLRVWITISTIANVILVILQLFHVLF